MVFTCVLLLSPAWAQTSGIAGVVRDTSQAVLPGVTVEASSPALIEKVRTVVTDNQGRYRIVDLRPGTYTVTFNLPWLQRRRRREGVSNMTTGFTATVNADLAVGALEETITVTGASPLVDTQNVRTQTVASDELLDVLPTGTNTLTALVKLTPGLGPPPQARGDVGGSTGYYWANRVGDFHGRGGLVPDF